MEGKNFHFNEIKIGYDSLLKMLKENTFSTSYPLYAFLGNYFSYKIYKKDLTGFPVIIFRKLIKVNIKIQDSNKEEIFLAHSNLDIENYCKEKAIDINSLYLNNGEKYNNNDIQQYCFYIKDNELELFSKEKEELPDISPNFLFEIGKKYKVKEYSTYYKDYFENEDLNPDYEFEYMTNDIRNEIFSNILSLQTSYELETFKFTGPFNIGKTITLLEYCRTTNNAFYLNLKYLTIKSLKDSYIMLREEFSRIAPDIFQEIQDIIKDHYSIFTPALDLIFIIMEVFFKQKKQYNFLFIFDQYKEDIFSNKIKEYLKKINDNIKIVYCSSINENKIRKECLSTWNEFKMNPKQLNKKNQKYYFYYIDIYSPSGFKSYSIMENITSIKRFKKYIKNEMTNEEKLVKIKDHISEKMTKFSSQVNMSFDHMITYLKTIINKNYDNEKLDEIMEYCPLKYFIVRFLENNNFKIQIQFPFINQIINRGLYDKEIFNYFKNRKYLRKLITNKTIKGDYFEEAVKKGLNIILPNKYDHILEVEEIISMKKIEGNSLDYDYLEDDSEENEEEEDFISEEDDKENLTEKEIDTSSENNNNDELLNLDELLEKFFIDDDNDDIDERNLLSDNLESYRKNEIMKLKKNKDKRFRIKKDFTGDETFLITQKSKKGRVIDCAYLEGKRDDKTFIAFQMKCYFDETKSLKQKARDKTIIKRNLQKILINSMYLLNCKINHWYYYLIFYYNPLLPKCNVNQKIIDDYKGIIEILFYDPLEKIFYDWEHSKITKLPNTDKANLDIIKKNLGHYTLKSKMDYTENIQNESENIKSFMEDFKFLKKKDEASIKNEISKIMKISGSDLILDGKVEINNNIISYPDYNFCFLYKSKNLGFLGMKTAMNCDLKPMIAYYDLFKKKEITASDFNQEVNMEFEYLYILKIKRRTYNNLDSVSSDYYFPMKKRGKFDN